MLKVIITTIIILISQSAMASSLPDDVNKTILTLRADLTQYSAHEQDVKWLEQFRKFLSNRIVESSEKNQIIAAACLPWQEGYYQDCITGSLSFYSSTMGTSNTLRLLQENNCFQEPSPSICSYYETMLHQDISQLKYILQIR